MKKTQDDMSFKEQLEYLKLDEKTLPTKNSWAGMDSCPHCGCDIKNLCPSGQCENSFCEYGIAYDDSKLQPVA